MPPRQSQTRVPFARPGGASPLGSPFRLAAYLGWLSHLWGDTARFVRIYSRSFFILLDFSFKAHKTPPHTLGPAILASQPGLTERGSKAAVFVWG